MLNSVEARIVWSWAVLAASQRRARRVQDERGQIEQTVIIVAILAAAAIVIATIIATKFKDKASSIPTE